jgi:hypothetical protein
MIITPEMFKISERIEELRQKLAKDPGDYMINFEFDELVTKYDLLDKMEKMGLKVINGGKNSNSLTKAS